MADDARLAQIRRRAEWIVGHKPPGIGGVWRVKWNLAADVLEVLLPLIEALEAERDEVYKKGQERMRARASFLGSLAHATVKDNADASSAVFDMTMGIRALPIEEKP